MRIGEMMKEAVKQGQSKLAHYIYWAIQQGASPQDDYETMNHLTPDWEEIERLEKENVLSINTVKLYVASSDEGHHLCLAYNPTDAKKSISEHTKIFNPVVRENNNGMYNLLHFPVSGRKVYMDELLTQCVTFPYYVGVYVKSDDACYRGNKEEYTKRMNVIRADEELVDKLSDMYADGMINGMAAEGAMDSVRKGRIA